MIEIALLAVAPWIGLGLLWWYFLGPHRDYWDDRTRQALFAIRDELFAQARNGALSFDSRAYGLVRTTLNGMIRFTHDLSISTLMVDCATRCAVLGRDESDRYDSDLQAALAGLDGQGRRVIQHARQRMHGIVLRHLIHTSPLLWPLFVPALSLAGLALRNRRVERWATRRLGKGKSLRRVEAEAHAIGKNPTGLAAPA